MTQTLEATKRVPARTSAAGQVVSWSVEAGQTVGKGDEIGIFEDEYGPLSISAPESGRVGRGIAEGKQVEKGAPLIFVEPTQTLSEGLQGSEVYGDLSAPHALQRPRRAARAPVASEASPEPPTPPEARRKRTSNGHKPRRSTLPAEVEELQVETPIIRRAKHSAGENKVKHRGYYIFPRQEKKIAGIAARLTLDEEDPITCNDSLIIRALIDQFEALPPGRQRAIIEAYKYKEEQLEIGSGWPRPGRPKRK